MIFHNMRLKAGWFVLLLSCLIVVGCSARPNAGLLDPKYQPQESPSSNKEFAAIDILEKIRSHNDLLAKELGKLPELIDGITDDDLYALKNFMQFYMKNRKICDEVFLKIYAVGKPAHRRYCSPLQAIFWLAEEDEFTEEDNPFSEYTLPSLLDKAWVFKDSDELERIIDGTNDQETREYFKGIVWDTQPSQMVSLMADAYAKNPNLFNRKSSFIFNRLVKNGFSYRWRDFDAVVDRLNSPQLLNYYEQCNLTYINWRAIARYENVKSTPWFAFENKKGDCVITTSFTVYCLNHNGYRAWREDVPSPYSPFHAISVFIEDDGKKQVMDNGRVGKRGIESYELYRHY